MSPLYDDIAKALAPHGLALRGGFAAEPADGVPPSLSGRPALTLLMIGNVGGAMWEAFTASNPTGPDPLDRWTRDIITPIAALAGARAVYPSDQPPLPFQRWAQRAWPLHASPLGLLIDADYGLWHAFRAALLFPAQIEFSRPPQQPAPCVTCVAKPCLDACPIDAFTAVGFDYVSCRQFLATPAGSPCLEQGCKARAACPVGAHHRYPEAQLQFHQRSFSGIERS